MMASLGVSATAQAEDDALITAMKNGQPILDMRLRYEGVDNDSATKADALTLRSRLGWQTGSFHGVDAVADFEDTRVVGKVDNYAPFQSGYPVVADPQVTELNEAYLRYRGSDALQGFSASFGRQRIIYDNARFVGNVGWRQDEQTYDGLKLDYQQHDYALSAAYLTQVNGIMEKFDANVSSTLLNASWKTAPGGSLTAYGYLLSDDSTDADNDTYGLRYAGKFVVDPVTLLVTLEGARQSVDAGDTNYYLAELGGVMSGVTVKLGQEVLGSDSGKVAFQTPLATKHAFNGWADLFLATPANGLQDRYLSVGGKLAGVKLAALYHDFKADAGSSSYGTETDLLAARPIGKHYVVGLKYADYRADEMGADTRKLWAWGELKF
ncbi:MAG: alginate export family protein [Alcanivorax sp.]|nr:alginate export family protein [Alcanivorax sp.]